MRRTSRGGCVRDLLLGREPEDYDVATSATPDVVLGLFPRDLWGGGALWGGSGGHLRRV